MRPEQSDIDRFLRELEKQVDERMTAGFLSLPVMLGWDLDVWTIPASIERLKQWFPTSGIAFGIDASLLMKLVGDGADWLTLDKGADAAGSICELFTNIRRWANAAGRDSERRNARMSVLVATEFANLGARRAPFWAPSTAVEYIREHRGAGIDAVSDWVWGAMEDEGVPRFDLREEWTKLIAADPRRHARDPEGAINIENLQHLIGLPRGWATLFLDLLGDLPSDFELASVVEKFGELRCSPIGDHEQTFDRYTQRSRRTCASCGALGRMQQSRGYDLPYCEPCGLRDGFADPLPRAARR